MQHHQQLSTASLSECSAGGLDSSRRRKPSVTFPPLLASPSDQRATVASASGPQRKSRQLSGVSHRLDDTVVDRSSSTAVAAVRTAVTAAARREPAASPHRTGRSPLRPSSRRSSQRPRSGSAKGTSASAPRCTKAGEPSFLSSGPLPSLRHCLDSVTACEHTVDHLLQENCAADALVMLRTTVDALHNAGRREAAAPPPSLVKRQSATAGSVKRQRSSTTNPGCVAAGDEEAAALSAMQRLAVVHTVASLTAAVRCSLTAESLDVQKAYLQSAMRYLVRTPTEDLFPEWENKPTSSSAEPRPADAIAATRTTTEARTLYSLLGQSGGAGVLTDLLGRLLRCAVRTNAAVILAERSTRGGHARLLYELLRALAESGGVWAAVVFYNLAVGFLSARLYDEAAEAIARCMELSTHYLSKLEATLRVDRPPSSRAGEAARAMHGLMAQQLISGHHFIATMAAWCDPAGLLEVQHCEMAAGCAAQYLKGSDERQRGCQRRLAAALRRHASHQAGTPEGGGAAVVEPPLLPFLTYAFAASCTQNLQPPPSDTEVTSVGVGDLVEVLQALAAAEEKPSPSSLWAALANDLPSEVQAYVRAVDGGAPLRYWSREAQRCGSVPPLLSAAHATGQLPACVLSRSDLTDDVLGSHYGMQALATQLPPGPSTAERDAPAAPAPPAIARPPGKPPPYFVTTLPQSTFQRYRSLRSSVVAQVEEEEESAAGYIGTSHRPAVARQGVGEVPPHRPSGSAGASGRRLTALLFSAAATSTAAPHDVGAVDSTAQHRGSSSARDASSSAAAMTRRRADLLRQLDSETEVCYSRLVADPMADSYRGAATRLQSWWRSHQARRERSRRRAAVALRCLQEAEAYRIQCVVRGWLNRRRRAAAAEARCLAHHRAEQLAVVQAFLRYRHSVETWGRVCLQWHRQLLDGQWKQLLRHTAASKLQSWWRMCHTQAVVAARIQAALRLQSWWREALARAAVRARPVQHVVRLQRWWRRCRACVAARQLVERRRRAVEDYLVEEAAHHTTAMTAYTRGADDAVAAMRVVLGVLAGARDRRQLASLRRLSQVRARALTRYALRVRGRETLRQLRRAREDCLCKKRREEEVAVAAVRVQAWARRWLPHRRRMLASQVAATENTAAARIQARWRQHQARRQLALSAHSSPCEAISVAARRIQAWYRTQRTRQLLRAEGIAVLPELRLRDVAAQRIQMWWCSRRQSVQGACAVLHSDAPVSQLPMEPARHAYATCVQAFVRCAVSQRASSLRRTLPAVVGSPLTFHGRRVQVPQPPTAEVRNTSEAIERAATVATAESLSRHGSGPALGVPMLPGFVHNAGAAKPAHSPPVTPESAELVVRPSPSCSVLPHSMSRLTGSTDKPLLFFQSDSSYAHDAAARTNTWQSSSSSSSSSYTDATEGATGQPVRQQSVCTASCCHTSAEIAAAVRIQALWRGCRARQGIEFYYEEFYEEVDEEDGDGDEGLNAVVRRDDSSTA